MALPEYKNLTALELRMADHYADIGDAAALRNFQKLSASREGRYPADTDAHNNPLLRPSDGRTK